jgi:inner membrane protein
VTAEHGGRAVSGRPLSIRRLLTVLALATVVLLDAVLAAEHRPVVIEGLLDEPAHLLTAWLLLAALLPERHRRLRPWALLGAVAIDLDHVPLYLWGVGTATLEGRPVTHSLTFVLVLLILARVLARWRLPLVGLALGVCLHLVRDLATGPGVALAWPATNVSVLAPFVGYQVLLVLATAAAVLRPSRTPSERPEPQPLK